MIQKIFFNFSCSEYKSLWKTKCYADIGLCEPGTFVNNDTKQCELCTESFLRHCMQILSLSRTIFLYFLQTGGNMEWLLMLFQVKYFLKNSCPNGFYSNITNCTAFPLQCSQCTSNTVYYNCNNGYYLSGSSCFPCDDTCKTCNSEGVTTCTLCNIGRSWKDF